MSTRSGAGEHVPERWLREHPLVFVDDLDQPVIEDADDDHLRRSRRLAPGDEIALGDGRGSWRPARLGAVGHDPVAEGPIVTVARAETALTVAFAPVKGLKPEWVVQKLTELGVDHLIPLRTDRGVVRWDDDRAARAQQRWARIIREAAMQSRQLHLPSFSGPRSVADLVADSPGAVLADPDGVELTSDDRTVAIGPEGGWSAAERALARHVALPGGILRAETAVVAAGTLMAALRTS